MSFYIHLPSNISGIGLEKNRPSNYTTYLPKEFSLEPGEWEVGLDEVFIPFYRDTLTSQVSKGFDVRHTPQVWIETFDTPDEATQNKIVSSLDHFYCMLLPKDVSLLTPKDVLMAIANLKFNGKPIMTFDASTNRLMSINIDRHGYPFKVYIFKTLAAAMGFQLTEESLSTLWQSREVTPPLWYNFASASWYPKVSKGLVKPIPKIPFETTVLNLNEHNFNEDLNIAKVVLAKLDDDTVLFKAAPGALLNKEYPMDLMHMLLAMRLRGDYTVGEVLDAFDHSQDTTQFSEKRSFGFLVQTKKGFRVSAPVVSGIEQDTVWTYMIHRTLATSLGLKENLDFVAADNHMVTPDLFRTIGLPENNYVVLKPIDHQVDKTAKVDIWSKNLSPPRPVRFLHNDYTAVFVNTDLIESHVVGNANANVLRLIHVNPEQRSVYERYLNPQFFKIRTPNITKITIYLTDEQGREIDLTNGLTFLTLIFRRMK